MPRRRPSVSPSSTPPPPRCRNLQTRCERTLRDPCILCQFFSSDLALSYKFALGFPAMSTVASVSTGPTDLLIGGEWREAERRFDVVDPSDESVITTVAAAGLNDAADAVDAAAAAAPEWAGRSPRERA